MQGPKNLASRPMIPKTAKMTASAASIHTSRFWRDFMSSHAQMKKVTLPALIVLD